MMKARKKPKDIRFLDFTSTSNMMAQRDYGVMYVIPRKLLKIYIAKTMNS